MEHLQSLAAPVAADNASALANSTWSVLPSAKDLLMVVPRAASRAVGIFTDSYEVLESLFGGDIRERAVAAATAGAGIMAAADNEGGDAVNAATGGAMSYLRAFNMQQLRTFGGIFNYMTSKWCLCCFLVAIILNRTSVYAATRRHLRLRWEARLFLRSLPVILLLIEIQNTLRGIRCQTSPDFSVMRYGVRDRLVRVDLSQDAGFLYKMSSTVLFGEDDERSCMAVHMLPRYENQTMRPDGSLTLLWPAFKTLCFSKFIEVLSSTVQGLPAATETGMSLFEHSLAYAEAESMIGNMIGIGPLSAPKSNSTSNMTTVLLDSNSTEPAAFSSRSDVLSKFNTSPEVLLITLISLCNSVSSHLLGVFGKQAQYRLLSTGIWGVCFLACFVWAFNQFSMEKMLDSGIFRFPTVCVVGFFPHLLIVAGIVLCTVIYLLALGLSVVSPPAGIGPYNHWTERFAPMYENMQANMQFRHVRINMREDFYTALLRLGLSTLTAASEAVFLNEGRHINLGPMTWLEEERISQMSRARRPQAQKGPIFVGDAADDVAGGVQLADTTPQGLVQPDRFQSGYARERTTKILKTNGSLRGAGEGVGTLQRYSRYSLALDFVAKIARLVIGWVLLVTNKSLEVVGIRYRPTWMRRLLEGPRTAEKKKDEAKEQLIRGPHFLVVSDDGTARPPKDRDVDVEAEVWKSVSVAYPERDPEETAKDIDGRLYRWFLSNGWWGDRDSSGDFTPVNRDNDDDDDTTSVVSFATDASASDAWQTDDEDDGRRTPTQRDFVSRDATSNADSGDFKYADLIRLLDPQDLESRTEARILAKHLASDGIVTRSRFNAMQGNSHTRLLTSNRFGRPPGFTASDPSGKLSPHEEAEVLEFIILKARQEKEAATQRSAGGNGGSSGGVGANDDAFSGGPQCVVCQTSPRTIMAWPCRCLSLCEDCRISLAMNNFGNCVCCRQEVVGFSRLFVP